MLYSEPIDKKLDIRNAQPLQQFDICYEPMGLSGTNAQKSGIYTPSSNLSEWEKKEKGLEQQNSKFHHNKRRENKIK